MRCDGDERMTEQDDGSRKIGGREIGEGPYDCGSRQATVAERRVSVTVEFKIAFREVTPETAVEMELSRDPREVEGDEALVETVEMQGRLLRALLQDEEALRQFIACAVIDEVAAGGGELLRKGLKVKGEEEALRPVIEVLGGEVAEYYAGVKEGMFAENIELLIFSTPVKCLVARGRVVDISEGAAASPIITLSCNRALRIYSNNLNMCAMPHQASLPKIPLPKLLHSRPRGITLPAVGVTSAFRRSQDTLIPSRH